MSEKNERLRKENAILTRQLEDAQQAKELAVKKQCARDFGLISAVLDEKKELEGVLADLKHRHKTKMENYRELYDLYEEQKAVLAEAQKVISDEVDRIQKHKEKVIQSTLYEDDEETDKYFKDFIVGRCNCRILTLSWVLRKLQGILGKGDQQK